jgi:agmatinase
MPFDIGILGAPFDTAVSYRTGKRRLRSHLLFYKIVAVKDLQSRSLSLPCYACKSNSSMPTGARFGPRAIRAASARQVSYRGFNHRTGLNPYHSWATILDCGDIPITPFDNALALEQMSQAYKELLSRPSTQADEKLVLISLGGDHSIALAALRALREVYGQEIAVLHFDAHLDTWHPRKYPNAWLTSDELVQSDFTHGSMFWMASEEGLIANHSSVHAGLRTRLSGNDFDDYISDTNQGFLQIEADDIDTLGTGGVIKTIMDRIGTKRPVYLSVDIDVLDPGFAPGTGTPEPGGWTTRELIRIIRGVEGLNIVGADVVEVSPSYDGTGEQTALAAAQVVYELLTSVVKRRMVDKGYEALSHPRGPKSVVRVKQASVDDRKQEL